MIGIDDGSALDRESLRRQLSTVEKHIAIGMKALESQRRVLAELERDGHETLEARKLLVNFEKAQGLYLDEHKRLSRALERMA